MSASPGASISDPTSFGGSVTRLAARVVAGGPRTITGALGLIGLMALGSVVMWLGVPIAWLWLGSRMQNGLNPSPGPYILIAVAIPISMVLVAKVLRLLDHSFARLVQLDGDPRMPLPWAKSMRDAKGAGRGMTVLEIVMLASVGLALAALGLWVAFFGGPPPSSVSNGGMHL